MADPYAALADEKFDPALHWKGDAANSDPNGPAMFSHRSGEHALVGKVDAARAPACLRYFLGYSQLDPAYPTPPPGGVYLLKRTPPVYHPRYPRLVCVSAAAEEFKLKKAPATSNTKVGVQSLPVGSLSVYGTSIENRTSYEKAKIVARFAPCPYPMLTDTEVFVGGQIQEWRRWTTLDLEPRAEVLSLQGFKQIYTEGTGLAAPTTSPQGKEYPAEVGQVLVKTSVRLTWSLVSDLWLFGRDAGGNLVSYPRNIVLGLGTVNETNFLGFLAGTLMLESVKMMRYPWGLCAGDAEGRFHYDVEFGFSFFDPTKGYTGSPAVQLNRVDGAGEPTDPRGHNCLPHCGSFETGDLNAGLWFGATYNGSTTGRGLFAKSEFRKLFNSPLNAY